MSRPKVDVNHLRGPTGSLLHSLDHPGGRILVLLFLVVIGCVAALFHIAWADHISLGALPVLLFLLGGMVRR